MSVVSLTEVKSHLNLTVSTHDGELQAFIDSAEAAIGERVGPLSPITRTVRVTPAGRTLRVPAPAIGLTSVTDADGTGLTVADLYLNPAPGLVEFNDGQTFGSRYYTVVYQAGRTTCPADLKMAVKELVRHLWTTQRGPTARAGLASEMTSNSVPGAAYAFPIRVEQLLKPHAQIHVAV
jgi:hypothetical protein